uniref:Uncharacterized protein n=1 Tax=Magallana gigas TaxID=29159 RepID=K1R5X8_MAGGI
MTAVDTAHGESDEIFMDFKCLDPRLYVGIPGACGVPLVARLVVTGSRHAC